MMPGTDDSVLETRLRPGVVVGDSGPLRPVLALVSLFPEDGARYPLDTPAVLVGRSPEAHVQLDHPSVSRLHARIEAHGARLLLVDLERAVVRMPRLLVERDDERSGPRPPTPGRRIPPWSRAAEPSHSSMELSDIST